MSTEDWVRVLDDIKTWDSDMLQKEMFALEREYPNLGSLYEEATRKFVQHLHRGKRGGTCAVELAPVADFVQAFLTAVLRRHDVRSRAALKYNIADRKTVGMDSLRLTLMNQYHRTSPPVVVRDAPPSRVLAGRRRASRVAAPSARERVGPVRPEDSVSRIASVVNTKLRELNVDTKTGDGGAPRSSLAGGGSKAPRASVAGGSKVSRFKRAPRCFWQEGAGPPSIAAGSVVQSVRGDDGQNLPGPFR